MKVRCLVFVFLVFLLCLGVVENAVRCSGEVSAVSAGVSGAGEGLPVVSRVALDDGSSVFVYDGFDAGFFDLSLWTLYHYRFLSDSWGVDLSGRVENGVWNLTSADFVTYNVTASDLVLLRTDQLLNLPGRSVSLKIGWNTATTWHDFSIYATNESVSVNSPVPELTYWVLNFGHSTGLQYGVYDVGLEGGVEFRNREVLFFDANEGENVIELKMVFPVELTGNATFSCRLNEGNWTQVDSWPYSLDSLRNFVCLSGGTIVEPSWYAVDFVGLGIAKTDVISNETYTADQFAFSATAPAGAVSVSDVFVSGRGEPFDVLGAGSWVYLDDLRVVRLNVTHAGSQEVRLRWDFTAPVTAADFEGVWHTSDFLIVLSALDDLSGVADICYRVNGGSIQTVSVQGFPCIMVEGLDNTLEFWSIDNVGNEEFPHKTLAGVKLDKSSPFGSVSISAQRGFTNSVQVELVLTAIDVVSGVDRVRCSNDGVWDDEAWEPLLPEMNWTLLVGDGAKQVYFQIRDSAGLISSTFQDSVILDTVKPNAVAGQDVTVEAGSIVSFDASGSSDSSGVGEVWWDFGDGSSLLGERVGHVYVSLGTYVVTLYVVDLAGNVSADSLVVSVVASQVVPMWVVGVVVVVTGMIVAVLVARKLKRIRSRP